MIKKYITIPVVDTTRVEHVSAERVNINGGTTGCVFWNHASGSRCGWHGSPDRTEPTP